MFKIKQFIFNPFDENTYLLIDVETLDTLVVDPGMFTDSDFKEFDHFVSDNKLKVRQLVNTHLHVDHCFGDNYVMDRYGVKVSASTDDSPLGQRIVEQARRFGIPKEISAIEIDTPLKDGDIITVGKSTLEVLAVPGHSPGGISLYCKDQNFVLTGDSLFRFSIGRTDLPGGCHAALVKAVRDKLLTLPDATKVLPGHGPFTTIGDEKRFNQYL